MTTEEKKERALALANLIIDSAFAVSNIAQKPVPNANLLRKRPFPDRKTPHRKKREMKGKALSEQAQKVGAMAYQMLTTAMQMNMLRATPYPKYPSGGINNHNKPL